MNEQEKIISKIKKLLSMTEENGCSPEEAAVAVAHAQLLMAKYDVQVTELSEEEKAIIEEKFSFGTKSVSRYQSMLAATLSKHFAVRVIICTQRDGKQLINIIGDKIRAAVYKETYLFAYKAFQQQWTAYHKKIDVTLHDKNEARDSYFRGFISGLENEIIRSENENAIVLREDPKVEEYMQEHFPALMKRSIQLRGVSSGDAYDQGYADGVFSQRNKNKSIQEMEG